MRKLILALAFSLMSYCTTYNKMVVSESYKIAYLYDFKTELCYAVLAYNVKTAIHYSFTVVPCNDEVADEVKRYRYTISDFTKK
jgi:hypothetical protein